LRQRDFVGVHRNSGRADKDLNWQRMIDQLATEICCERAETETARFHVSLAATVLLNLVGCSGCIPPRQSISASSAKGQRGSGHSPAII
jgi:hypothetical protein